MEAELFAVGGGPRDELLGQPSKDLDVVAVEPRGFDCLLAQAVAAGLKIHLVRPEFVTIRATIPAEHPFRQYGRDIDIVLARKDGVSSDGRRPDYVVPGTLTDDLLRRDFTANALARSLTTGALTDIVGGVADIQSRTLRFVGDPMTRIREDGLRVLRGLRFMITKGFQPAPETWAALVSEEAASMLGCVSIDRTRDEVEKMVARDTLGTLALLAKLPEHTLRAIFRGRLRLSATLKAP